MPWELLALILLAALALMLLAGQWMAFALGSVGTLMLYLSKGPLALVTISSVIWNTANNYILVAVPLFLLMGEVILRCGVSGRFYWGVSALLAPLPGGLLHATIVACAIFSAISGSSVATAAAIGTVAIPELTRRGYHSRIVLGSLAAGGTLGILIPPSIILLLYGALVEESVAQLFMAGVVPGLLMAGLFMAYTAFRVALDRSLAPPREARLALGEQLRRLAHVLPIIVLLLTVLGGIYTGVTTPTEAAAIGALGAMVLAACYRSLSLAVFKHALLSTVRTTCMVIFIIIGAQILSAGLTYTGVSRGLSEWIVEAGLGKWQLFAALIVLYVVLGFFVDGISMIYLTLPVLYPVIVAAGFDVIWFGVVLTILIEMGQITPPVGLNLFTIQGISGGRPLREVVLGSAPFVFVMLVDILLLAFFPDLALWLPSLM